MSSASEPHDETRPTRCSSNINNLRLLFLRKEAFHYIPGTPALALFRSRMRNGSLSGLTLAKSCVNVLNKLPLRPYTVFQLVCTQRTAYSGTRSQLYCGIATGDSLQPCESRRKVERTTLIVWRPTMPSAL